MNILSAIASLATIFSAANSAAQFGQVTGQAVKKAQARQRAKHLRMFPSQAARRLSDELGVRVRAGLDGPDRDTPVLVVDPSVRNAPATYEGYPIVYRTKRRDRE